MDALNPAGETLAFPSDSWYRRIRHELSLTIVDDFKTNLLAKDLMVNAVAGLYDWTKPTNERSVRRLGLASDQAQRLLMELHAFAGQVREFLTAYSPNTHSLIYCRYDLDDHYVLIVLDDGGKARESNFEDFIDKLRAEGAYIPGELTKLLGDYQAQAGGRSNRPLLQHFSNLRRGVAETRKTRR